MDLYLADDGKKMSKSLKNYPSPMEVIDQYGADGVRLYLIHSPVVHVEPLRFKKEGVYGVITNFCFKLSELWHELPVLLHWLISS